MKKLDSYFGITAKGSTVRTEIVAGITTFLAMCYILTVNPNQIFYNGSENPMWASVFIATALGATIGCLLMAFLAKVPYAQAPGMGLNSTVGGIIGGGLGFYAYGHEFTFGNAMLLVLISGVIFLLLTAIPCGKNKETGKMVSVREKIFDGIPVGIRRAIPVGIGLFIAFIGLQNAGMVTANQYTLVEFANLKISTPAWTEGTAKTTVICLFSLLMIAVLSHYKVKGSIILGVLAGTVLAIPMGVTNISTLTNADSWKFWENFTNFASAENGSLFACFRTGFNMPAGSLMTCVMLIVTFAMIDMFDTMGTVLGCATKAGLLDESGKPLRYNATMYSDAIATCTGALLGTSTVTTFVESGTGIAAGGKTGLVALVNAVLFLLAIFLLPVFAFIPSAATAAALIYVGVVMMSTVKDIDFTDVRIAVPAFLTILMMPMAYSITGGIGIGIVSYVVISLICWVIDLIRHAAGACEKPKFPISIVMAIIFVLFLVYFLVPTTF
ncbi:MAG: NCS2 family permease [Eubacteriales bacterium]